MSKILVTGAAGFIGSHLVDRYLADGHEVVGLDNLLTGSGENLEDARANAAFAYAEEDVSAEAEPLIDRLQQRFGRFDLVLHFASPASPVDYGEHPIETLAVNSRGTEFCLRAALRWRARMLFASTSEAYGDPLEHPQSETYWGNVNPVGPRSCYDESKRFGEALVMAYCRAHDLDARTIRIFNTYGPRMRRNDGRVVPNFIAEAIEGKPLTIYGDGSQTRSFCYVDDLIEGIVRCAASEATRGHVVNLGNPEEYSISEFAQMVSEIVGVPLQVRRMPLPPNDPTRRKPDITKAREMLQWEPQISVRDGLARTVRYFERCVA